MSFPPDLRSSPLTVDDFGQATAFVRRASAAESGRPLYSEDDIETWLGMPGFDLARDSLVARDGRGEIAGAVWVRTDAPYVTFFVRGHVAPERTGEGIGTALMSWAKEVAIARIADAPPGSRVVLATSVDERHQPSVDLMRGEGMEIVRHFLEMRIDFDADPPDPVWPEGVELRPFDPADTEIVHRATHEAFEDHFGHVDHDGDEDLERFRRMVAHWLDREYSWIVWDGDDVAAAILGRTDADGDESIGYVGSLSVRRPWRGRGIAKAMLQLAFGEYRRHGKIAVTLHVDAESLTGATRLYESVGMRESERYAVFESELRPGEDLVRR